MVLDAVLRRTLVLLRLGVDRRLPIPECIATAAVGRTVPEQAAVGRRHVHHLEDSAAVIETNPRIAAVAPEIIPTVVATTHLSPPVGFQLRQLTAERRWCSRKPCKL
jgi:hypothetical protein